MRLRVKALGKEEAGGPGSSIRMAKEVGGERDRAFGPVEQLKEARHTVRNNVGYIN